MADKIGLNQEVGRTLLKMDMEDMSKRLREFPEFHFLIIRLKQLLITESTTTILIIRLKQLFITESTTTAS